MDEGVIGYVVSFVVLAVMGFGLPRWFEWRRSLVNRLQGWAEDGSHRPHVRRQTRRHGHVAVPS